MSTRPALDKPTPEGAERRLRVTASAAKAVAIFIWVVSTVASVSCGSRDAPPDTQTPTLSHPRSGPLRFVDVTASAGLGFGHSRDDAAFNLGGGAAAGDYNDDGLLDIYVTNSVGANALYRNNGDGTFSDVAEQAGVDDPEARGNGAAWGDYDNDGDLDLFVASYGKSKLFRNDGNGSFSDVTHLAGVGDPEDEHRSMGVAWGDYDRDGFLDLLVVRHVVDDDPGYVRDRDLREAVKPLVLYHNGGDGTFTDRTALLGDVRQVPGNVNGAGFKPCFVDYDDDGDPDIYVVNDFGEENYPNVLWRNDGPAPDGLWTFTDVSKPSATDVAVYGMGLAVGDYDNDGDMDFYITDMGDSEFLENRGDGTFANVTDRTGTGRGLLPGDLPVDMSIGWGAVFADLDNDGFLDLYYVAGQMDIDIFMNPLRQPNAVLANNGDGTFRDVSISSGADDDGIGREVVVADFNGDGLVDLYVANLGRLDGTLGSPRLFQNRSGSSNHWIAIKLTGTSSNRGGVGARVKVTAGGITRVQEAGSCQGHMSQSVVPVHFGLGDAAHIDLMEIVWPSGIVQTLRDLAADQVLQVTEP